MERLTSSWVTSRRAPATATWPGELRPSTCWPPTLTKARSIFQPEWRSAFSTAAEIEWTVWSILTTTPLRSPDAGTVPFPMIVTLPSRPTSPIRATTLVVPTSIPTRTASRSTRSVPLPVVWAGLQEMPADERDVLEDPQSEGDERVHHEPADEDPVVVRPFQLGPHGPQDGVKRREDRDGRIPSQLEPDVD